MQDRNGSDPEERDEPEPTRTEVSPNVVRLTPREEASLRAFVQWQTAEPPESEKSDQ